MSHREIADALPNFTPTAALQRIVVGTDFSDAASRALQTAIELAAAHGAELTLVHAVDPMIAAQEISSQVVIDDVRKALEHAAEPIKKRSVAVATTMRLGKAWWALEEVARETNADLVVLASHGRSGLARIALGSTADRVLRTCAAPVLMIPIHREGAATRTPAALWKDAVVGIDFSEESLMAANLVARLFNRSDLATATIVLFNTVALAIESWGSETPVGIPEHWDKAEADSKKRLEDIATRLRTDKVQVVAETYRGYASDGILQTARTRKTDTLALGTHGRGTVNRMLLGSVAERVLHHADCPVLTVRHPATRKSAPGSPATPGGGQTRA